MHPDPDSPHDSGPQYLLNSAEALLAGTLALMTAMVQGSCSDHREMMKRKVMTNLAEMEKHPGLSQQFHAVASHLQQHWHALGVDADRPAAPQDPGRWHCPPASVQ